MQKIRHSQQVGAAAGGEVLCNKGIVQRLQHGSGGVGVRNIIDLYLLDKQITDRQSLNAKLERVGLAEFDKNFQILAKDLFDNQTPTKQSQELMEYIYESEYLGGQDQKELFAMAMAYDGDIKKAKQSSVWQKIFPPYRHMVGIYPSLKKCPILLPIYHIRRYFAVIFKRRKNFMKKLTLMSIKH